MLLAVGFVVALLVMGAVGGVIGLLSGAFLAYVGSRKDIESMRTSAREILERNRADHASQLGEAEKKYVALASAYRDLHAAVTVAPHSEALN